RRLEVPLDRRLDRRPRCRRRAAQEHRLLLRSRELMDDRPIGVFDSGFGGLTVARAMIDLLPDEDVVYFGDSGRYPYGPRPLDEVREFARQIADLLVDAHDVKMIVVACN